MQEIDTKQAFKRFRQLTTSLAALLIITDLILETFLPALSPSPARSWLIIFFLLITNLVFYYQLKASNTKSAQSVNIILFTTGFKLLFFLIIIVIYALIFKDDAVNFIIDFLILYLIFTLIEVSHIRKFQHQIKNQQ